MAGALMKRLTFRAGVLTCSDLCFRTPAPDESGRRLIRHLRAADIPDIAYAVSPDEPVTIRRVLLYWSDVEQRDLIVTTGGTGFGPRDHTPEVTRRLLDREAPGLMSYAHGMTAQSHPYAALSRGVAGVRGCTLIVNFPGRPEAVDEYWACLWPLISHALRLLRGVPVHPHDIPEEIPS